jgi:epoxyqueuosine reductase
LTTLSLAIQRQAHRLGFDHCRIAPVQEAPHADFFDAWVHSGRAGEMHYLERNGEKRRRPRLLVKPGQPQPRSLIVLAVNHYQFALPPQVRDDPSRGLIASYAWGDDYHEIIRPLLYELDAFIRQQTGRVTPGKCLVDSGPVLERAWAMLSGIGFTGKNCCTIHPQVGSWLLLATILVPETLEHSPALRNVKMAHPSPDDVLRGLPWQGDYGRWSLAESANGALDGQALSAQSPKALTCGRCDRCLAACPTQAFVGPFHLDPQRCISYWTIESRSPVPRPLRPFFANRIFGCDICQEVCPWNRRLSPRTPLLAGLHTQNEGVAPHLLTGFEPQLPYWLDETAFARRFQRSPIVRAKRRGMARNVCIALGNWGAVQAIPALTAALQDAEALVRGHAAWALGQVVRRHRAPAAYQALLQAQDNELDPWAAEEIALARGE